MIVDCCSERTTLSGADLATAGANLDEPYAGLWKSIVEAVNSEQYSVRSKYFVDKKLDTSYNVNFGCWIALQKVSTLFHQITYLMWRY